jgi:hypothetical protein
MVASGGWRSASAASSARGVAICSSAACCQIGGQTRKRADLGQTGSAFSCQGRSWSVVALFSDFRCTLLHTVREALLLAAHLIQPAGLSAPSVGCQVRGQRPAWPWQQVFPIS